MTSRDEHVVNKYAKDYERDKTKAEALEEKMKKSIAAALKKRGNEVAKDFMRSQRDGSGERSLEEMRRTVARGTELNEDNWGNEVTGDPNREDRYWEDED